MSSFSAHCASIGRTWLRFPVGTQYAYSNLGIDLTSTPATYAKVALAARAG